MEFMKADRPKEQVVLQRPQRAGFDRYSWSWCYKCGAPTWAEKPNGLKVTSANLDQVTLSGPTCDCDAGWFSSEKPNAVHAATKPADWFVRRLLDAD